MFISFPTGSRSYNHNLVEGGGEGKEEEGREEMEMLCTYTSFTWCFTNKLCIVICPSMWISKQATDEK